MGLLALLLGMLVTFNGYRLFLFLLPFWGFFFGFGLGAQTVQAFTGGGFLGDVTSWVVGFFVGVIFAVLSYLIYFIGVVLFSASLGYALGAGFMSLIGIDFNLLVWVVGIIAAIVVAGVTILFNLQKWVIIIATAFGGSSAIIATLLAIFGVIEVGDGVNAVKAAVSDSFWWLLFLIVLWVLGILAQGYYNRDYLLTAPENRI
jgi:hypothetical protein